MQLKDYQERVIKETGLFLQSFAKESAVGGRNPSLDAWDSCRSEISLRAEYFRRQNGKGKDLPNVCIKVPTGGGKTLLATKILGEIYRTTHKHKNGTGLVLWIVPSDQIYKDTIKALKDRKHAYRESIEFSVNHRVEVWEKTDIGRITPSQLASSLNILVLVLASTNRATKDQLKFFQDAGGQIVSHFPPEDEPSLHKSLKNEIPNLEMIADDDVQGIYLVKTSIANLVRISDPVVILDEGHKATSALARNTLEDFNASIIVELSATPHEKANIISRVSGDELLKEQMIKLPINVVTSSQKSWKDCLTSARDKRIELNNLALEHYKRTGKYIRPIVLIQVERTGKDQKESQYIHSDHVKEFLIQKAGINPNSIAIKSSEVDDLELLEKKGITLLDDGCPVEWIITKGALQEGWDCPFAYILVSLNNSGSKMSLTQLVGRILRQPNVARSSLDLLNQSFVYCLRKTAAEIIKDVKKGLEEEGYEGDLTSIVRDGTEKENTEKKTSKIRGEFKKLYEKEFSGKIYLPHFSVREGKGEVRPLDYYKHLFSNVSVKDFSFKEAESWDFKQSLSSSKDQVFRMAIGSHSKVEEIEAVSNEADDKVEEWLVANLAFESFSQSQLEYIVDKCLDALISSNKGAIGLLSRIKFDLITKITGLIKRQVDHQTHEAFNKLYEQKKLIFFLECRDTSFCIPSNVELRLMKSLRDDNDEPVQKSLFDYVPDDLNDYERSVALYLDKHPEVLWWFRNLVGAENFSIQGYRKNKIYPDFVVQQKIDKKLISSVLVVESKGKHLSGNEDTLYKKSIAEYFDKIGKKVTWQKLAEEFEGDQFRFQILDEGEYSDRNWKDDLNRSLLESSN